MNKPGNQRILGSMGAESFNQPIGEWNVSKVTRMYRIFWFIDNFNPVNAPWCYVSYSYSDDE